jgi:hypothetical protein
VNAALAAIAVLVALSAIRTLRRWLPPRQAPPSRREEPAGLAGDLERIQRTVGSTAFAGDVHWRLRPLLREVAAAGLLRHRVRLDEEPERARELVSPDTWELVRPDRPRPDEPLARGLAPGQLDAVLDDLEALLR